MVLSDLLYGIEVSSHAFRSLNRYQIIFGLISSLIHEFGDVWKRKKEK